MPSASLRRSATFALLAGLALGCTTHRSPQTTVPTAATTEHGSAEIDIDPWQVPHVYAESRVGVARGFGWAQMRAYPDEILRLYAVARGRGADGRLLAIRTGIDDDYGGCIEAWMAMGRARDLPGFEAALEAMHLPLLTVGYADRDGHVLYLSAGRIPQRTAGDYHAWRQPMPGDRSALVWEDLLPYRALPRVLDPPSGFVQNSNSGPWLATLPPPFEAFTRSPWLPPEDPLGFREIRGLRMLSADPSISFDELRQMHYSAHLQYADHVLDDLVAAAQRDDRRLVQRAADLLSRWDREATADSRGAVLFERWVRRTSGQPAGRMAVAWSADDPLHTPRGLAEVEAAVDELEVAAREVIAEHGALDVSWGEANRLRDDLPATGASGGDLGSFHAIEYAPGPDGRGRPVGGDTFVALVELTPDGPRAEVVLSYGNASPSAPFAADQLDLIAAHRLRRPLLDRAEVEDDAVSSARVGDPHLPSTTH